MAPFRHNLAPGHPVIESVPPFFQRGRGYAYGIDCGKRRLLFIAVLLAHSMIMVAMGRSPGGREAKVAPGVLQVRWMEAPAPAATRESPPPVVKPRPPPLRPRLALPTRAPLLAVAAQGAGAGEFRTADPAEPAPARADESTPATPVRAGNELARGGPPLVPPGFEADYLSNPAPVYPALSRQLKEKGVVSLRIHVTAEGRADTVQLHQSSGFDRLDQAASEVVWRWRFVPARLGQEAVAAWVIVPIHFILRS